LELSKVIACCGLIGAGKDTVANYLIENYGFTKLSFAASLKDAVSSIFGWERKLLEGDTKESREWREQVDQWWANKLQIPNFSPRLCLQLMGTDVMRNHFHNDIWVTSLENKIRNFDGNIIITDCRFKNELDIFDKFGANVIRVRRGPEPDWFDNAKKAYNHDLIAKNELENAGIHASEYSWCGYNFKWMLENDGLLDNLYVKIDELMLKI
jgi:hypothetical protein